MPDTFTAWFNFTKPEVNASRDTWGGKDNANWDALDGVLHTYDVGKLNKGDDTISGAHNYLIMPTWGGAPLITEIKVRQLIPEAIYALMPYGTIIMWSGSVGAVPVGWALCDGTLGTPDLRARFVIGAGLGYSVGAFGGAGTHNHGGSTGGFNLAITHLPAHNHSITDPGHGHGITDPGHTHDYNIPTVVGNSYNTGVNDTPFRAAALTGATSGSRVTGVTVNNNTTGITVGNTGGGTAHVHSIGIDNNIPPYFVLAYIMRTVLPP